MKPDGIVTAALESMESLESNPIIEAGPTGEPEANQAASPAEEEILQEPERQKRQMEPQPEQTKDIPSTKTGNKSSGESKDKSTNKATAKTKHSAANTAKTTSGPRMNTSQNHRSNGTVKPESNGVAKKTPPAVVKKSLTNTAAIKKRSDPAVAAASKSKLGEKNTMGATMASNGAKLLTGTKKTSPTTTNDVRNNTNTAAAPKKFPAPKPASVLPTKSPVSKTASPSTAPSASSHPNTVSDWPSATGKNSLPTAKFPTLKSASTASKTAASKPISTTPSNGKLPASKNSTPGKKDVKPATTSSKKLTESTVKRPSSTTKSPKTEIPKSSTKSDVTTKKITSSKAADTKTPSRSKLQDNKTPSKDTSKTPITKTATTKTSSPKKAVGSSTPTPVKHGSKAKTVTEPEKEIVAVLAADAAIATAAAAFAGPVEIEPLAEIALEPFAELLSNKNEAIQENTTPETVSAPLLEEVGEPTSKPIQDPTPELMKKPIPELLREPTREPIQEPTPEPLQESVLEPIWEPTPEPVFELTSKCVQILTQQPIEEHTPELVWKPSSKPVQKTSPDPIEEHTSQPLREQASEPVQEPSPEPPVEPLSQPGAEPEFTAVPAHQCNSSTELLSQSILFKIEEPVNYTVSSLGTTVMSPPSSPAKEPLNDSSLMDSHLESDPSNPQASSEFAPQSLIDYHTDVQFEAQDIMDEEKENLFKPPPSIPSAEASTELVQSHVLGVLDVDDFTPRQLLCTYEQEEAVEKADEEINEDDDDEDEEDEEDEEQRRIGHQLSPMVTDMSRSQLSEFQVQSSTFGGTAEWQVDGLLSRMDSEDTSSCQKGVSDLSSIQHTATLEGTHTSDALVDASLCGSEGDGIVIGSPTVETHANEEEEDERVNDMYPSSESMEECHKVFLHQDGEEEDGDVEMHSEGVTESDRNADEDDLNEEECLENLSSSGPPCAPPTSSSWGQSKPFSDPLTQPASLLSVSSPSPLSDHGTAESETPTLSPGQAHLDIFAHSLTAQSKEDHYEVMKALGPDEDHSVLTVSTRGMPQPSILSTAALAIHSGSETSTPEDLHDYDSSSGVESRSDKQQTPVPASFQPEIEQDQGIHLEKGDGEEEEAETLPADEVPETGSPTAPASVPSSPSASGDEASDTDGEMQITVPDGPATLDDRAEFDSPTPTHSLPALVEDEVGTAREGEEDGGGATPQSANSVASYGFDCTTSNSNAHSMAESCGKSPGIFSLENEEQLPEEAKDPSLIKELTRPTAAATSQPGDMVDSQVDLMPLEHQRENQPGLDEQHYMQGGKMAVDHLEGVDPPDAQEPGESSDMPYYSTICEKTDSFLAGDKKTYEVDEDYKLQTQLQEDNHNQNHTATLPVAIGHYLALVPGNRRPIDSTVAAHFAKMASPPPPPLIESNVERHSGREQLRRLEQHQKKLREMQQRQEQERQKRQWLEEERLRLEQQKHLEKQRIELLQLQQQQEHQYRRQVQQWQLELEQQYRMQHKQIHHQQQLMRRSPTGLVLSPSSGLCTIYEAMETSDEEEQVQAGRNRNVQAMGRKGPSPQRQPPPKDLEWNKKVDMVQLLINQTLMLSGDRNCPPLLLLPMGTGGTLSPLENSMWPNLLPQFSPPAATITSVSSYSPDSQGSSSPGDWTVVEVETQH